MKKLILSLLLTSALSLHAQQKNIVIQKDSVLCASYMGNGVQWSAYPSIDIAKEDWDTTFERLDFMKLNFVRLMVSAGEYCTTYPKGGKPEYKFNSDEMQRVYKVLDYCEKNKVQVILGDWSDPVRDNKVIDPSKRSLYFDGIQEYDPRWTEMIGELIHHLIVNKKYTCIKYYNLGNEPNGYWMSCESFDTWKQSIVNLDAELKKRGYRDRIKIVGPDAAWANEWIKKIIDDKELVKLIDSYEVHWYASKEDIEDAKFQADMTYWRKYISENDPKGKEKVFFMGEAGMAHGKNDIDQQTLIADYKYGVWMADFIIQSMNAGQSGLIAWDLDDAMHTAKKVSDGDGVNNYQWKIWGFWDSFGKEKGHSEWEEMRPWYYTWSLLSKYIPAGSKTLKTSDLGIEGLRSVASKVGSGKNADYTFALVNQKDTKQSIKIAFPSLKSSTKIYKFEYTQSNRSVDKKGFPKMKESIEPKSNSVSLEVPGNSVIILTTLKGE